MGTTNNQSKAPNLNWRYLINELTHDDIDVLLKMESAGSSDQDLVEEARIYAQTNIGTRIYFEHLPEPAGAVEIDKAFEVKDCGWVREFVGTSRPVASFDNIEVTITGKQHSDGEIERYLDVTRQARNNLDTVNSLLLDAADVRQLIAVLLEAADELDAADKDDLRG